MSLFAAERDADCLRTRRGVRINRNGTTWSSSAPDPKIAFSKDDTSQEHVLCTDLTSSDSMRGRCDPRLSLDTLQRIRQHLSLLACLRKQEGVAQVEVNNQRALYLRYQELVESDVENVACLLRARNAEAQGSPTRLADASTHFLLDKDRLFEQAKLLHDVESTLSRIKTRMAEIGERLDLEFNSIFATADAHTTCELETFWTTSKRDAELPKFVTEYFHKLQELAVLDDRLADLTSDHDERDSTKPNGDACESLYQSRRAALEAQMESLRAESIHLKERCVAQGSDPEVYRYRRSSSCSASDLPLIRCDNLDIYDAEFDAIRIT